MKIENLENNALYPFIVAMISLIIICIGLFSCAYFDNDSYYNQYNKGFLEGYNGTIEEYNYSISFIEYCNNDNSRNFFKTGEQGHCEGFIDGYGKKQLENEKEKLQGNK